MLCNTIEKIAP